MGDHSRVFPHVALRRSTLPWERSAEEKPRDHAKHWSEAPTPWLAVLVYDEDDLKEGRVRLATPKPGKEALTVATLDAADSSYSPKRDPERGNTVISAVDVKTEELKAFLPTKMECRLLCHVRRNILISIPWTNGRDPVPSDLLGKLRGADLSDDRATIKTTGEPGCWRLIDGKRERSFLLWENATEGTLQVTDEKAAEYAFVIGNRLPRAGKTTTAHLISLEGRSGEMPKETFEEMAQGPLSAHDKLYTRFVSLHQWRFSCESHEHTFEGLMRHLNPPLADEITPQATLRLPGNTDEATEKQLAAGFTLLPHQFRDGSQSYSWYRGPLAPGPTIMDPLPLPAESSDALLVYDKRSGLFYTGYASAWELGRMLCIANSRISQALYQWKREHRRMLRHTDPATLEKLAMLPVKAPSGPDSSRDSVGIDLPQVVREWFASLKKLEPLPFRYLVPDERMLPVESIRFFEIDPSWINCLLDGAFSIGRILEGDHEHDKTLHLEQADELRHPIEPEKRYSGLLLRSAAVSGWPLMTVEAKNPSAGIRHERVRFDRLAPDILLCLFQGAPTRYEIHLPMETVHFGVDLEEAEDDLQDSSQSVGVRDLFGGVVLAGRRLSLKEKVTSTLNPAVFAHAMVAGVPRIVFMRSPAAPGPLTVT